jgi:hypothetical protein
LKIKKRIQSLIPNFIQARWGVGGNITAYAFDPKLDPKKDVLDKYGFRGDLANIYANNKGAIVHKWHHYLPLYDRYFSVFRGRPVKFLEIGVSEGGSLQMWREYFGSDAIIFGIDINPDCAKLNGLAGEVRIGSQADPKFLDSVIEEMGGVDVILDDGSHQMGHIKTSFKQLFPRLSADGIYMIEDLCCSYWRPFGGGYRSKSSAFHFISEMIDDMHHWYHLGSVKHPDVSRICTGIHVHESVAVFEIGKSFKPTHSRIG